MAAWSDHSASSNAVMLRKGVIDPQQQHGGSGDNSSLVAMLSSAGLRGGGGGSSTTVAAAMPGLDQHHRHHHHHHSSPPPPPPPLSSSSKRPLYATMLESLDETGDGEIADDGSTGGGSGSGFPEKKRRLSVEQVRSLEMSFEMENRLEPVRKMQLAQELGLQPRQVAVWFQNRRARWKTKQLEKDYDILKAAYESLAGENKKLKALLNEKKKLVADDEEEDDDNDEEDLEKKVTQQQQQSSHDHDENLDEDSGSAADKVKPVVLGAKKAKKNKSTGVDDYEVCTTPDSPTVVSSKFKDSPLSSSDGYNSDVLDAFSPHPAPSTAPKLSPLAPQQQQQQQQFPVVEDEEHAPAIKEEPVAFPFDEHDALRGLEDEASYSCLFGATADEQGNWASWWDWS